MSIRDFNNITTATIVFNVECTKVLLIQREADEAFPSQIAFPGGRLQIIDEDIIAAARREVKEEAGLNVGFLDFLGVYFAGETMMVAFVTTIEETTPRGGERRSFWFDVDLPFGLNLAPNVKNALNDALEYMAAIRQNSMLSRLGEAVNKATKYLRASTSTQDGYIGWDHFLGRGRVAVIGTALGVLALCRCGLRSRCISEGVNSLENSVLPDGGWGLRSILDAGEKISIAESTLYVLSALLSAGMDSTDKVISNGIDWLIDLQHESGGWGTAKFGDASSPRVFPTAFAISVLSQVDYNRQAVEKAVSWLRSAQKPDGSWGVFSAQSSPDKRGTAAHTARSILALLDYDGSKNRSVIDRGIHWLIESYDPRHEQGWLSSSEVTFVSKKSRVDFKHFATPWVLMALMQSGTNLSDPLVIHPLVSLLNEQAKEGYWTHHLAAGQIPIWATHDCLMAINEFKSSLWKDAGDLALYRLFKEKHLQLLSLFVSREISRSAQRG